MGGRFRGVAILHAIIWVSSHVQYVTSQISTNHVERFTFSPFVEVSFRLASSAMDSFDPLANVFDGLEDDPLLRDVLSATVGQKEEGSRESTPDDPEGEEDVVDEKETASGCAAFARPQRFDDIDVPKKKEHSQNIEAEATKDTEPFSEEREGEAEKTLSKFKERQLKSLDDMDDFSSAWRASRGVWGKRSFGGRGAHCSSSSASEIVVQNLTLSYAGGVDLLDKTTLKLGTDRRYGLIGPNGCGKTTLLMRMASGNLPGFPLGVNVLLVEQEVLGHKTRTPLQYLVELCSRACYLRDKIASIASCDTNDYATTLELSELEAELDDVTSMKEKARAKGILRGLGFSESKMSSPTATLSGGWRMRLSLAASIMHPPDVLLLDEPTNHLDLHSVLWLQEHLSRPFVQTHIRTVVVVSHDRDFLDAIVTDVIVFRERALHYATNMNVSEYLDDCATKRAHHDRLLDARIRQETHARNSIESATRKVQRRKGNKMKGKRSKAMEKKQRQIAQQKKKMDRIGLYRDDGKRYKLMSLRKLDASALRLPSRVEAEHARKRRAFAFPEPSIARSLSASGLLIRLEDVRIGYADSVVLDSVDVSIRARDRVAVVGRNGTGKSTLLAALLGTEFPGASGTLAVCGNRTSSEIFRHPMLRVAHVAQHHIESLIDFFDISGAEHLVRTHSDAYISTLDARAHLASFGIVGDLATKPIGFLSGGQRTRLALALAMFQKPNLLILDEPTNHLDTEALDALADALRSWGGTVVLVSHMRSFCRRFCKDLWEVRDRTVSVRIGEDSADGSSFGELLETYCDRVRRETRRDKGKDRDKKHRRRRNHRDAKRMDDKKRSTRSKAASHERTSLL